MYNPPRLPLTVHYPIQQYARVFEEPELGTRVLPRATVHGILATLAEGKAPTFQQIKAAASSAGVEVGRMGGGFVAYLPGRATV